MNWVGSKKKYVDFIKSRLPSQWDGGKEHLVSVYVALQNNLPLFLKHLKSLFVKNNARLFDSLKARVFTETDATKQAAFFFYMMHTALFSFICKAKDGESYTAAYRQRAVDKPLRVPVDKFCKWAECLKDQENVIVAVGDFRETTRHARKGDFVFLDPPYWNEKRAGRTIYSVFAKHDHERLLKEAARLDKLGCFVMLFNHDHPSVLAALPKFHVETLAQSSRAGKSSRFHNFTEIVLTNYPTCGAAVPASDIGDEGYICRYCGNEAQRCKVSWRARIMMAFYHFRVTENREWLHALRDVWSFIDQYWDYFTRQKRGRYPHKTCSSELSHNNGNLYKKRGKSPLTMYALVSAAIPVWRGKAVRRLPPYVPVPISPKKTICSPASPTPSPLSSICISESPPSPLQLPSSDFTPPPPIPWNIPNIENTTDTCKRIRYSFEKLLEWARPAIETKTTLLARLAQVSDPPSERMARGIVQSVSMTLCIGACRKMLRAILKRKSRKQGVRRLSAFLRDPNQTPDRNNIINATVKLFSAFWTELDLEMPSTVLLEDHLCECMMLYVWIIMNDFTLRLAPPTKRVRTYIEMCIPGIAPLLSRVYEGKADIEWAKREDDVDEGIYALSVTPYIEIPVSLSERLNCTTLLYPASVIVYPVWEA